MKRLVIVIGVAAVSLAVCAVEEPPIVVLGTVSAQDAAAEPAEAPAETPAEERATSFKGVEGAATDNVPGGTLLLVAYAIIWLMVFGFFWRLRRLQQRNSDELARLAGKVHGAPNPD